MIKANFNAYNSYVTDSLYQWDKDRVLEVSGINIAIAPEIHFNNIEMDRAIVRHGTLKNGVVSVKIPNSMLQSIHDIRAYIGVWEGSTFKTVESILIPIIVRDKPSDYVLDVNDEEYYSFSKLENEIANMVSAVDFNRQVTITDASIERVKSDLEARISKIIHDNQATEGNTELLDLRTGYDYELFPTAGDAVRGQTKEFIDRVSWIEKLSLSGETMYTDLGDICNQKGYITKQGTLNSHAGYVSDFIKVKPGDEFYVRLSEDFINSYAIALYDVNKNFLRGVTISTNDTTYKPTKASHVVTDEFYIRFTTFFQSYWIYKKIPLDNKKIFDDLKRKIGNIEYKLEDITDTIMKNKIDNSYIDGSGYIVNNYPTGCVSDFIKVREGDAYKFNLYVLYENPACTLYDKHKKMLITVGKKNGFNEEVVIVPKGAEYMRFSTLDKKRNNKIYKLSEKSIIDLIKENKKEKTYIIPKDYIEIKPNLSDGYINGNDNISLLNHYYHTDYIELDQYPQIIVNVNYGYDASGYVLYDENKEVLYHKRSVSSVFEQIVLNVDDIRKQYVNAKYIRFSSNNEYITRSMHIWVKHETSDIMIGVEKALRTGNILYDKKIAFCGDSFTEASNLGVDLYDPFYRCYKSYGWRIANRNEMRLYHDGVSGSTMYVKDKRNPTDTQAFSHERYKKVPKDSDYIILQFGLNESSIAGNPATLGTKDSTDVGTMWGAYNTVLKYLITNCPTAKIGIICSDAWIPQKYYEALKSIAEWWGVPLLDLGGDPNVSLMNGGRRVGSGLSLNPEVAKLRNNTFYANANTGDSHPNDIGHEWRSTVIENWIRGL